MSKKEEVLKFIKENKTTIPLEIRRELGVSLEEWEEIKKELIIEGRLKPLAGGFKCKGCPYVQSTSQGAIFRVVEK